MHLGICLISDKILPADASRLIAFILVPYPVGSESCRTEAFKNV